MEIFNYDNRSLRLLNILESNFLVPDKYLIDVLKVSSKTINNEIKSLNEIFGSCAYIESKNSNYSLYIIKLEEYLKKKRSIYEAGENFDSSKVRLVYIFKKLVSTSDGQLIDDLAFEMIVSRTTLNTDLKKLNEIINDYNLVIKGKPNIGIKIVGLEKDIRIFILENINDSEENFIEIANFLNSENIRYDKIQLNTIDRVGAERDLKAISFDKILKAKKILEENGVHDVEIIKSLSELEENQKIQINKELLDNMKQKRLYQEEEINKIFKKS